MKISSKDFRVPPGKDFKLGDRQTTVKPFYKSGKHYKKLLEDDVEELSNLQQLHYASNRYALLLIFQGMDSAGKDGAIRHVMSGVDPQGCEVFSFKQPSTEELQHDFLWRTTCHLPERGRIGIFNRSYYEEVLVVRVHPEMLRNQGLRDEKDIWEERFALLSIWRATCIETQPARSRFSFTSPSKSSESDFSSELTNPIRTGNSASQTFTSESIGNNTWRPMRLA